MDDFPPLSIVVWNGDVQEVLKFASRDNFASAEEHALYINSHDVGREAPIITAFKMQRLDIVRALFLAGAKCYLKDRSGLSCLFWALLYFRSDPSFFTEFIRRIAEEMDAEIKEKVMSLQHSLASIPNFTAQMNMEFSTWLPLVKRFLPNDKYTVTKQGCSFRVDCTLAGFKKRSASFRRGNITLLLLSDVTTESMDDFKLIIIDHVGRRFARIDKSEQQALLGEEKMEDDTLFSLADEDKAICQQVAQECIAVGGDNPVWDSRAGDLLVGTPIAQDESNRMIQWAASSVACTTWPTVDIWSRDAIVRPIENRSLLTRIGFRTPSGPITTQIGAFTGILCEVENMKVSSTLIQRLFVKPPLTSDSKSHEGDLLDSLDSEEQEALMAELNSIATEMEGESFQDRSSISSLEPIDVDQQQGVELLPVSGGSLASSNATRQMGGSSTSEVTPMPPPRVVGLELDAPISIQNVVSAGEEKVVFAKEFLVQDAPASLLVQIQCNVVTYDIVIKVQLESKLPSGNQESCVLWSSKIKDFTKELTCTFPPGEHNLYIILDNSYSRWTSKTTSMTVTVRTIDSISKNGSLTAGNFAQPVDPLSHCVFRTTSAAEYYGSDIPNIPPHFFIKPNNVLVFPSRKRRRYFNIKAKVALSDKFPFTLPQFLPIVQALARTNRHFDNVRRFLEQKIPFPDSFPAQIEIPIFTKIGLKATLSFPSCRVFPASQLVDPSIMSIPEGYRDATEDIHNVCFFENTPER